jgi:hypothetical protein
MGVIGFSRLALGYLCFVIAAEIRGAPAGFRRSLHRLTRKAVSTELLIQGSLAHSQIGRDLLTLPGGFT